MLGFCFHQFQALSYALANSLELSLESWDPRILEPFIKRNTHGFLLQPPGDCHHRRHHQPFQRRIQYPEKHCHWIQGGYLPCQSEVQRNRRSRLLCFRSERPGSGGPGHCLCTGPHRSSVGEGMCPTRHQGRHDPISRVCRNRLQQGNRSRTNCSGSGKRPV